MKGPLRIAVLEADTPLDKTRAKYGSYGGVFEVLLKAGAKLLGRPDPETGLQITKHSIVENLNDYPDLSTIDAILITGSRHDSFENVPWINKLVDYTATVLAQDRVRIIGVCFGHQIVGRALGVKVGRNKGEWEAAVHDIALTERGKQVFGKEKLRLHQMHRDIVFTYPEGVEELGSSPICKVQGMYTPRRLITVQGHPEFNEAIVREVLETRHATGIFDEAAYQKHIKKVGLEHDGVVVGSAFIQFLLDD